MYVTEDEITVRSAPHERLRTDLVQSVAMIYLLVERWNEAPRAGALHLSTLVQQLLSTAAQRGGFRADDAWRALCDRGPFRNVDAATFGRLLRDMAAHDLIGQTHDATVVLALAGERLVNHYDFYSAFVSSDEYRLVHGARTLGSLPVSRSVSVDDLLLFAGQRWRVLDVRDSEKLIELEPAPGGRAPRFSGGGALIDDRIRSAMFDVYRSSAAYDFVDQTAGRLVEQGRRAFAELDLGRRSTFVHGSDVLLFPWVGDRAMHTLALMLRLEGFAAAADGVAVLVTKADRARVDRALEKLAEWPPEAADLTAVVQNKILEKHHPFLSEELLDLDYASSHLDRDGAIRALASLARSRGTQMPSA